MINPKDVAELIKSFERIDKKNKNYYGNKTQRKACEFLIEEYGKEAVEEVLDFYLKMKEAQAPFLPLITSPFELQEKWEKVADFVKRNYQQQTKNHDNVIF